MLIYEHLQREVLLRALEVAEVDARLHPGHL